jgi:hypothetical protein
VTRRLFLCFRDGQAVALELTRALTPFKETAMVKVQNEAPAGSQFLADLLEHVFE